MDVDAMEHAEALLWKAARTYNIQIRKDELQHHLRDNRYGTELAQWANMYLTSDTLLTADELAIYTALDRNGQVDVLSGLHDLAEVQAVSEEDIKIATQELRQSTEFISTQSETLRLQQDALSSLVKNQNENIARRRDLDLSRQSQSESERQRVAAEVEAASQSLAFRISDLDEQGTKSGSNLTDTFDEIFRSDDKLLASLQKLGWELEQPDPDETSKLDKLRETCMRLIKITVETTRARLDTVYIDALVNAEHSGRAKPATMGEVKELEAEIESLYTEILPVAQMSVERQHLEPTLKSATTKSGESAVQTSSALEYINECLDYLLDRLGTLQERCETHLSHQAAAASLISTAREEMAVEIPPPPRKPTAPVSIFPSSPTKNPTPVRKRSNTVGSHHRRRSSGVPDESPLDTLINSLSLPPSAYEEVEGKDRIVALARVLEERQQKYDDVARNAQEAFEIGTMAQLNDTRHAIQLLRDSVLAESPYNEPRLVDPEISGSIAVLAQEVQKVKDQLALVEGQTGNGNSAKKQEFLQRWGP